MRRRRLIRAVAGILRALREAGGGTGRITMRRGRPALGSSGPAVLVPADLSDREIDGQAELYAEGLAGESGGAGGISGRIRSPWLICASGSAARPLRLRTRRKGGVS